MAHHAKQTARRSPLTKGQQESAGASGGELVAAAGNPVLMDRATTH
jgi:hypothetical protein